ncbi:MAG TPA: MFS transporter, partial [Longimicrobiales bacterium]|nr:MFS transporter [Longimicrobiales bacterium]
DQQQQRISEFFHAQVCGNGHAVYIQLVSQQKQTRDERAILGLLFVGVLMGALDIAIVAPALPALRAAFHTDERSIAWVLTAYVLCNLIGTPVMATFSDARGRRPVYMIAVTIFAVGSLLVSISRTFGFLLVGRAIQGFGAGGIFPVATAVIGDIFPVERRGRALGLIGAVFGLAFIVGPIVGGLLLLLGWPFLFLLNLPIAAYVLWRARTLLPVTKAVNARSVDVFGLLLLSITLFSLAFGLNRIDAEDFFHSITTTRVWPFLLTAVVVAPLFWLRQVRVKYPLINPSLFKSRQVVIASALSLGAGLSESAIVFVPALLVAAFAVTNSKASFMLLPIVFAMAVGAPLSGRMLDRVGSRIVIITGCALIGIGLLLVGMGVPSLTGFYTAGIIIGLGLAALLGSSLRYIMLNEAAADQRGAAQGVLTLFTSTGQLLGAAVVGAVVASHGGDIRGYDIAFNIVGACLLALALISVGLKNRQAELIGARRER